VPFSLTLTLSGNDSPQALPNRFSVPASLISGRDVSVEGLFSQYPVLDSSSPIRRFDLLAS